MQTAFSISTEAVLVRLLVQIAVILAVAKCVGAVFVRIGQSRSIGEILAGFGEDQRHSKPLVDEADEA